MSKSKVSSLPARGENFRENAEKSAGKIHAQNFRENSLRQNYTTSEFRTAESVSPKHPDKMCDQIADAMVDFCLSRDANSRVAVDCCGGHGEIFITGEITSRAHLTDEIIREIVARIVGKSMKIHTAIARQSAEIARGVDGGGAGDQGVMIGYACDDGAELMPLEVMLARKLNQFIFREFPFDGKTQITLRGREVVATVASFQNAPHEKLLKLTQEFFAKKQIALTPDAEIFVNPAGDWTTGGFDADSGLTGRKLAIDNYGPRVPLGGGAFSGKDATKVDRSAAYMARRVAVDYLRLAKENCAVHENCRANFAGNHEVLVRLAYAIGVAEPLEKTAIIDGESYEINSEKLRGKFAKSGETLREKYDLTPCGIIRKLDLAKPIYEKTAKWGHFGNGFNWDR